MTGILYLALHGRTYWAALLSILPLWTIIPLFIIYYQAGMESTLSYTQGLILITIPWLMYASCIIWFSPYFGLITSCIIGFSAYIVCALILSWLRKI